MVEISCRTNLDVREVWPTELPFAPAVGDVIQSKIKHGDFRLELEVVRTTFKYAENRCDTERNDHNIWYASVELWLPKHRWATLADFIKFYESL